MLSPRLRASYASSAALLIALLLCALPAGCSDPPDRTPAAAVAHAPAAGAERRRTGAELEAGFEQVAVGMSVDALRERLGPPNHVAADQWYFGERRAPRAGETIPVYVVTVRDGQVVAKRSAPGADAVGPPP